MRNIYLVGFMGTGKTAVGKELARRKKWQFLDLDELIEFRHKRTISDIFVKEGEAYFRRIEKGVLKEVSVEKNFVIACGGGIVLDKENIRIMKETGTMICLSTSVQTILKRTSGVGHRPLLNVKKPNEKIEMLLKFRAPFYAQADYTIDTSDLTIEETVKKIIKILKR